LQTTQALRDALFWCFGVQDAVIAALKAAGKAFEHTIYREVRRCGTREPKHAKHRSHRAITPDFVERTVVGAVTSFVACLDCHPPAQSP
jgi:hypothetical protein